MTTAICVANLGFIVWGSPEWVPAAVVLTVIAFGCLYVGYRSLGTPRMGLTMAWLLKGLAVVLLAALLVDPLWSGTRVRPGMNDVAILVDDSRSLQIHDGPDGISRRAQLEQVLADELAAWRVRLEQDFAVRWYGFGERLAGRESWGQFRSDQSASRLGSALARLVGRDANPPLAAVILLTDGASTDEVDASVLEQLPPVYAVKVGGASSRLDIRISNVAVTRTTFEDAPVTIKVDLQAEGVDSTTATVRLLDEQEKLVAEQTAKQTSRGDVAPVEFQVVPDRTGMHFYRVQVVLPEELARQETIPENNSRWIVVHNGQPAHRVLYVAGRPNWEFKFLNRAISDDLQLELIGLIRIARREAKFDFRSRAGETSNQLYRGFGKQSIEEAEQYDEPVLIRLNTQRPDELQAGFPSERSELFAYDAVILDDVEAACFTRDQQALLEEFVSRRGGGLLMLGGQESLDQGGYARTPIADALPTYFIGQTPARSAGQYHLQLTREGWLQPWIRLRETEPLEESRLSAMPSFQMVHQLRELKPAATALASAVDAGGREVPAVIAQRYGQGRSAVLTIGDLWRWRLSPTAVRADHDKAWRQMLRWLVSDVPPRMSVEAEPVDESGTSATKVRVRLFDEEFQPLENGRVRLLLTQPDGESRTMFAEASLAEPGEYHATVFDREAGLYRVHATAVTALGEPAGEADGGWTSDPRSQEFANVTTGEALLKEIADRTGGREISTDELDDLARRLPFERAPLTEAWTTPLWHQSWVLLLIVGCLVGEWALRRRGGLV